MDPMVLAQLLRGANQQGHRFDTLAAVAQMANNPGAAQAAGIAARSAQSQHKPVQMGNQGFMLPGSGQFVSSPMYETEMDERRATQQEIAQMRANQAEQDRILRLTLARQTEDGRNERAQDRNALLMTIAQLRASGNADRQSDRDEARRDRLTRDREKVVDKGARDFGVLIQREGLAEFEGALEQAEAALAPYDEVVDPKSGKKTPAKNIPGMGPIENVVPGFAYVGKPEAQKLRADLKSAANILLKNRSGAAVTEPEMRRFLEEMATGGFGYSEETIRHNWKRLRETFNTQMSNVLSTVDDDTLNEYNSRSPRPYSRQKYGPKRPAAASTSSAVSAPAPAPKAGPSDDDLIKKYMK